MLRDGHLVLVILLHTLLHFILPVSLIPGQGSFGLYMVAAEGDSDGPYWVSRLGGGYGSSCKPLSPQNIFAALKREGACSWRGIGPGGGCGPERCHSYGHDSAPRGPEAVGATTQKSGGFVRIDPCLEAMVQVGTTQETEARPWNFVSHAGC